MVKPMYDFIPDYRYRLIDYVGDGFLWCGSYGSAFHLIRGLRNSPAGGRLAGAVRAVRTNVPRVAGSGGASLALFWAVESATCLARRRDDHWNSIAAGAATLGLFNVHRGAPAATLFALLGAATFAGIAGATWSVDLLNSSLFYHFGKVANDHKTLVAMERNSEMTAKDDAVVS